MIKQDIFYGAECDVCQVLMENKFFQTIEELKAKMAENHWEIIRVSKKEEKVCCPYHVTETKIKHNLLKKK